MAIQKEKRNALLREKRAKSKCSDYLEELKEKNLLSVELEEKLNRHKGKWCVVMNCNCRL